MNERSMTAQVRKVRDAASFAFGQPITASLGLEIDAWGRGQGTRDPVAVEYRLWLGTHRVDGLESVSFRGTWKEVLSMVEWLQDVEAPVKFSNR